MESKVSVNLLRNVIYFAASKGASLVELCQTAGISPEFLTRPDESVEGQVSQKVWRKAEELIDDAEIGLHLGEQVHPSTLGLVGFVMLSCANLGEALEKLIRYTNLLTDGVQGTLTTIGLLAQITIEIKRDRQNFLLETPRQQIESSFATIATIARILTGKPLPVREMQFGHVRPPAISEHLRIFGASVLFSQPTNKIVFAAEALNYPILMANNNLLPAFEAQAEEILRRIAKGETRSKQVQREIIKKLTGDVPNISEIARELNVSERSLQRELATENTTFRELLDETRRESAFRHLQSEKTSVAEISFLLGFSEPSAFHRSFKRWTGTTPHAFRENPKHTNL
ncbi:MAG: AraC family transcriptional regulator ligand-binding domain-containing protein [Pyrinomonadaceae bacterium]|nr:AraC family transcriptional regulator ligand-binding domain-containing protein [Pyrinomonadaceae bacterium]